MLNGTGINMNVKFVAVHTLMVVQTCLKKLTWLMRNYLIVKLAALGWMEVKQMNQTNVNLNALFFMDSTQAIIDLYSI